MNPADRKRINDGLCDQKTIEQLTSSGTMAQKRRREAQERLKQMKDKQARDKREKEKENYNKNKEAAAASKPPGASQ